MEERRDREIKLREKERHKKKARDKKSMRVLSHPILTSTMQ
jgi:hypothetical protein